MLPMMLAAVPLAAAADEQGLCLSTTSLQPQAAAGGVSHQHIGYLWPIVDPDGQFLHDPDTRGAEPATAQESRNSS